MDDIWFGIICWCAGVLGMMWLGHYTLLHPGRPESPRDQRPAQTAVVPELPKNTPVSAAIFVPGYGTSAGLAHDRTLARTRHVVNTTLLELGGKGTNATVRSGNKAPC